MADRGPKISRTGYDDTTRPNDQLQVVSPEFPLPVYTTNSIDGTTNQDTAVLLTINENIERLLVQLSLITGVEI